MARLLDEYRKENYTQIDVTVWGGEPLVSPYFDEIVNYLHDRNYKIAIITNGVLIDDDVIDFANREMSNVVLSLDGRKEVHDRYRVDYAGNGSWEKIVPKFQKFVEARGGKGYYMRGTFTHNNVDFTNDIFHMLDLGFAIVF